MNDWINKRLQAYLRILIIMSFIHFPHIGKTPVRPVLLYVLKTNNSCLSISSWLFYPASLSELRISLLRYIAAKTWTTMSRISPVFIDPRWRQLILCICYSPQCSQVITNYSLCNGRVPFGHYYVYIVQEAMDYVNTQSRTRELLTIQYEMKGSAAMAAIIVGVV